MTRMRLFDTRHPDRRRNAALRLRAARRRFERSTEVLRKAAFDHIEAQVLAGAILEATLARITQQAGA